MLSLLLLGDVWMLKSNDHSLLLVKNKFGGGEIPCSQTINRSDMRLATAILDRIERNRPHHSVFITRGFAADVDIFLLKPFKIANSLAQCQRHMVDRFHNERTRTS